MTRNLRPAAALALLAALAWLPGEARADTATEASFHFKRGMGLVAKRKYGNALAAFFTSNRLSPNPSAAFNIARCLELLGHLDEAFSYYSELAIRAPDERDRADAAGALERVVPKVSRLHVRTTPPGATIYVDRKNLGEFGRSPRLFAAPAGEHELQIELDGYYPASRPVELARGALSEVEVSLKRIVGTLAVISTPPGAIVRLAGEGEGEAVLGVTPAELELPPGRHELVLELEGHEPAHTAATVAAEARSEVSVALDPLPPPTGRLTVTANYPGSLLELDERTAGFTPAVLDDVPVGEHRVVVSRDGFRPWTGTIGISREAPLWATVALEPDDQPTGRGPWPWVFALSAGAAATSAAVFGGLALSNHTDYEQDPTNEALERGQSLNLIADSLLATAGILGVASGALFLLTDPRSQRDSTAFVTGGATGARP